MSRRYLLQRPEISLNDGRGIVGVAGCDVSYAVDIAAAATTTLITIVSPQHQILVVKKFTPLLDDETALGFVTWVMKIDNIPVAGFNNITTLLGVSGEHDVTRDVVVPEGSKLTVDATNNTAFTYRIGAKIGGVYGHWQSI